MARKEQKLCVLQLDARYLHAVVFATGDGAPKAEAEYLETGHWDPQSEEFASAFSAFAAAHDLAGAEVYTVLPRHEIASRFLVFPTHDEVELASMVRHCAAEYVPFPEQELHIAQCFVSKQGGGEGRALAVYAQKELIRRHLELLRRAGITPAGIFLSTSCLGAAVDAAGLEAGRFALMNLAPGGIEVLVFENGRLFFGRAVAVSHEWPADGAPSNELVQELGMELRGSLSAYRRETEHGETVESVFLCSDVMDPSHLCNALWAESGKECSVVRFGGGVVQGVENLANPLQLAALGAVHLAMGEERYRINLLPEDMLRVRELKGMQKAFSRVGVFAALFMLALLGLFAQAVFQRASLISTLETQAAGVAPMAEGVASKQRQLSILRNQVEGSGNVLEAMWAVTQAAPPEKLSIVQFAYDGETGIDIFGQALSLDAVALFASNLRTMAAGQLAYFKNAKSLYENRGRLFEKEIYNFQITIPMKADDAN